MKILIKESSKSNLAKFLISAIELGNFCFRVLKNQHTTSVTSEVFLSQSPQILRSKSPDFHLSCSKSKNRDDIIESIEKRKKHLLSP